jgi:hypothetical protein
VVSPALPTSQWRLAVGLAGQPQLRPSLIDKPMEVQHARANQPTFEIALTHFIVSDDVERVLPLLYTGARRQDRPRWRAIIWRGRWESEPPGLARTSATPTGAARLDGGATRAGEVKDGDRCEPLDLARCSGRS